MTIQEYYHAHLSHIFGEEKAERIIKNSLLYSANLNYDSASPTAQPLDEEERNFDSTLNKCVFPLIGLYRAMLCEGFTEKEVGQYLKALWDIAPEGVKTHNGE